MASTRTAGASDAAKRHRERRQRLLTTSRAQAEQAKRQRLEEAVDAALSVVEAAVALLDAMDGDTDLEPACEDEGAACDDEGSDSDREPDLDGDGRPEPSWQIAGRDVHLVDGACRSWAERQTLDPDDAPDPLQPPRYGFECAR